MEITGYPRLDWRIKVMSKFKKKLIKSQRDISQIQRPDKKDHHPCGDSLFIRVEPLKDGLSMSFVGKMRHPVTKTQKEVTIGRTKDIKLSDAKTTWLNIKKTAIEQKCDPNKINISNRKQTLKFVTEYWLEKCRPKWDADYYKDVKNKCFNTMLPLLDADRSIRDYQLGTGGDELIEDAFDAIYDEDGKARYQTERKCRGYLRRIFEVGISKKWVDLGCNPVGKRNKDLDEAYEATHYPGYTWAEVPDFLKRLDFEGRNCMPQEVLALQLIMITGQRTSVISRLQWDWIDYDNQFIKIPGWCKGLKRMTPEAKKIPHYLPLTPLTKDILERAEHYTSSDKFVFTNAQRNRFPHLDPEAPSRVMRAVGNINKDGDYVTSHGWRKTFETEGQEVFRQQQIMLKKQMSHLPDNKVDRAYDFSTYLPMRQDFMPVYESGFIELGLKI